MLCLLPQSSEKKGKKKKKLLINLLLGKNAVISIYLPSILNARHGL